MNRSHCGLVVKSPRARESFPVCQLWLPEGRRPLGCKGRQPSGNPLSATSSAKLQFAEDSMATPCTASLAKSFIKRWHQLTSDEFIELVHNWELNSTERGDKSSISVSQIRLYLDWIYYRIALCAAIQYLSRPVHFLVRQPRRHLQSYLSLNTYSKFYIASWRTYCNSKQSYFPLYMFHTLEKYKIQFMTGG